MNDFYFVTHDIHDPYFNLSSEEYLLTERTESFIYVWVNPPSVILGVNQNAYEEVNLKYVEQKDIKVARRRTGGGAVYHDEGNVCYTIIAPFDEKADNYKKFTAPVIEYLKGLGVNAEFSGRNDITVDGMKISGNAQTIYKDRIMHHGTLLFNTDLTVLSSALNPNPLKMQSKGIKSIRARVTNIKQYIDKDMTAEQFKDGLCSHFSKLYPQYSLNARDIERVQQIAKNKYARYEWIYGRSPKGNNVFEARLSFGIMKIVFDSQNGKICNPSITGDFFSLKDISGLEQRLNGINFTIKDIEKAMSCINEYIPQADYKEVMDKMFENVER